MNSVDFQTGNCVYFVRSHGAERFPPPQARRCEIRLNLPKKKKGVKKDPKCQPEPLFKLIQTDHPSLCVHVDP